MNAVAIICSREKSSRLPGKVFKRIAGVPAIHILVKRVVGHGIPVIVAVPPDEWAKYHQELSRYAPELEVMSGNADSPLHRMAEIVQALQPRPKWVIRITHDDLLIDMQEVKGVLAECEESGKGYGVSAGIVDGAGAEVIAAENILAAANRREDPTEYVSYFVRGAGLPKRGIARFPARPEVCAPWRLTMDYPADAQLLEIILRAVGPDAPLERICDYIAERPYLGHMNLLPALSVYTCAKDAGRWVAKTVRSVLEQHRVGEYVFVDDGSKDETLPEYVRTSRNDHRASLHINESNVGLASSSNRALSACRGRYVMRIDADDLLTPGDDGLSKMVDILDGGAHVVYPAYWDIGEAGQKLGTPVDPRLFHHAGGALFDKRFLDELRFREGLRNWDGLELYERMKKAGAHIAYYDQPTWCYRQHPDSMSKTNRAEREKTKADILEDK